MLWILFLFTNIFQSIPDFFYIEYTCIISKYHTMVLFAMYDFQNKNPAYGTHWISDANSSTDNIKIFFGGGGPQVPTAGLKSKGSLLVTSLKNPSIFVLDRSKEVPWCTNYNAKRKKNRTHLDGTFKKKNYFDSPRGSKTAGPFLPFFLKKKTGPVYFAFLFSGSIHFI